MKKINSVIGYPSAIVEYIPYQKGNELLLRIGNPLPTNIYKEKSNEGIAFAEAFYRYALKCRGLAPILRLSLVRVINICFPIIFLIKRGGGNYE